MPLRDHFRPPLHDQRSWEELLGAWPSSIAFRLNQILPPEYYSGVKVRMGTVIEVDVATFEQNEPNTRISASSVVETLPWAPAQPQLIFESESPIPPEYEVLVYNQREGRKLVAAVELVSPGNKDRDDSRDAFVSKCHALLRDHVCVCIVDPVTTRHANLLAELADRLGAEPPSIAQHSIYAATIRGRTAGNIWRVETWAEALAIGSHLPTLPLWLSDERYVPLELESTYEDTCRGLRIS